MSKPILLNSKKVLFNKQINNISDAELKKEDEKFQLAREEKSLPNLINSCGDKFWKDSQGALHRDNDLPAVIRAYGAKGWYQDGKLHRDRDLSAVIYSDGRKEWCQHGQLHRDNDLPARVFQNSKNLVSYSENDLSASKTMNIIGVRQAWYRNGELHRDNDKPAVICFNGSKKWFKNGQLYRESGVTTTVENLSDLFKTDSL